MKQPSKPLVEVDFIRAVEAYFNAWRHGFSTSVVNRHANKITQIVDLWSAEGTAIERLHGLLNSRDPAIQLAAANSLVRLKEPAKALPILQELSVTGPGRISLDAQLGLRLIAMTQRKLNA